MLFNLGQVVATQGVFNEFNQDQIDSAMKRYIAGDWGEMEQEDIEANNEAVKAGERILASYDFNGKVLWIITEWDRSATTLLLPSEY